MDTGSAEHSFLLAFVEVEGEQANFLNLGSEHIVGQASQRAKHKVKTWERTLYHGTCSEANDAICYNDGIQARNTLIVENVPMLGYIVFWCDSL